MRIEQSVERREGGPTLSWVDTLAPRFLLTIPESPTSQFQRTTTIFTVGPNFSWAKKQPRRRRFLAAGGRSAGAAGATQLPSSMPAFILPGGLQLARCGEPGEREAG